MSQELVGFTVLFFGPKTFEDDLDQLDRSGGYGSELSQTSDVWEAALETRYLGTAPKGFDILGGYQP